MDGLLVENLSTGYRKHPVVTNVDMHVNRGKIVALVGPNGAGKTTLIRALTGILPSVTGQVHLDGVNLQGLTSLQRARRVAVVPQQAFLPDSITVTQVVLLGRTPYLTLWGKESPSDCRIAKEAMKNTGIDSLADRLIGDLSGGEQQRAVIARALAQEPDALLLDEPTAHLDLKHQNSILTLVRNLAVEKNMAVLLTMHDLNQAAAYAHHIALMVNGKIEALGTPDEVFTTQKLSQAYGTPVNVIENPNNGAPLVTNIGLPKSN